MEPNAGAVELVDPVDDPHETDPRLGDAGAGVVRGASEAMLRARPDDAKAGFDAPVGLD